MVPLSAESQRMTPHRPGILGGAFEGILKHSGVGKVIGWADPQTAARNVRIGGANGYAWHVRQSEDVNSVVAVGVPIDGVGEGSFTDEPERLGPHSIG